MPIEYFTDAATFARHAQPFLLKHEAENSLAFGIIDRLAQGAMYSPQPPLLALLRDTQGIAALAVMTPPRNLVLPVMDLAAVQPLAQALFADGIALPGLIAPLPVAEAFAAAWCALSGQRSQISTRERVYELTTLIPPAPVSGQFRWAADGDRPLLVEWSMAFDREALGVAEPDRAEHEEWAERMVNRTDFRGLGIWEDAGRMVSYAGFGGRTPSGIGVARVYTPPELRGRGYARAVTAALSAYLLERHECCFLNTDLANPTSNKIYQAIGYRPIGDALELRFVELGT